MMKGNDTVKTYVDAHPVKCLNEQITYKISIDLPSKCPCCKTAYASLPETTTFYEYDNQDAKAYCVFFCPVCEECFFVSYDLISCPDDMVGVQHEIFPLQQESTVFSNGIATLSSSFVKIYQQAEQAENQNLHDICGMGYRKALEFLIKDYAVSLNPDRQSEIESAFLGDCISTYIGNEKIKTLAKASAWIGNDETHYVRKHQDYNVQDLKRFIGTVVAFIEYELNYAEAFKLLSNPR